MHPSAQDVIWRPHPGPQTRFLSSPANEVLYGGAAGGGKSDGLIVMPLRWVHHPRFSAVILRRDTTQLTELWEKAARIYPRAFPGVRPNANELTWRFPSGARVWMTHCQHEKDIARFDGKEFSLVAFDELTHFTRQMYLAISARLRGPTDLPKLVRSTTNPGGEGHEWVMERWAPWLNPKAPVQAAAGSPLWYLPGGGAGETWCEKGATRTDVDPSGREVIVEARSRVFIPANLADNPSVGAEYRGQLMELDAVRRAQLLNGDWLIQPGKGLYFKRGWFKFAEMVPKGARGVRYWDRAATEAKQGNDPDWTVGLRMWEHEGIFYIDDIVRFRGTPQTVEATIKATAVSDGRAVTVGIEQDPGQAGKFEAEYYVRALSGWTVKTYPVMKDKITRAGPVSSQVEHGNVRIVVPHDGQKRPLGAKWLDAYFSELEAFPEGAHDDQVDTTSGGFAALAKPKAPRGVLTSWAGV